MTATNRAILAELTNIKNALLVLSNRMDQIEFDSHVEHRHLVEENAKTEYQEQGDILDSINEIRDSISKNSDDFSVEIGELIKCVENILIEKLDTFQTEISIVRNIGEQLLVDNNMIRASDAHGENAARLAAIESAALVAEAQNSRFDAARPKVCPGYRAKAIMGRLKKIAPLSFDAWKSCFDAAAISYREAPDRNCSIGDNNITRGFSDYVKIFAKGHILDIGCGPLADPYYLRDFEPRQLTGLEPLDLVAEPRFPVVKGVNEFLPWNGNSFDTVINATSIDHVLDLDRAIKETARVLKPDGLFIIWYANVKGAPPYVLKKDEQQQSFDEFHMFHADNSWFLDSLRNKFHIRDIRILKASDDVDNVFALCTRRAET